MYITSPPGSYLWQDCLWSTSTNQENATIWRQSDLVNLLPDTDSEKIKTTQRKKSPTNKQKCQNEMTEDKQIGQRTEQGKPGHKSWT